MAIVKSFLVQWSDIALADVDHLIAYVARRNPQRAHELWRRIKSRADALERFPYRSRLVPELKALGLDDYREIVIFSYRVMLIVKANKVMILGLFDGRRNMDDILVERALALENPS